MLNVVIVGAGRGGTSLLRVLSEIEITVSGVTDHDLGAPGIELARKLGVPVSPDLRDFAGAPGVDIIVQATGDPSVDALISAVKNPQAVIVEPKALNLILTLVEEKEKLLRELTNKERERDVILNSTHDAMLAVNSKGILTLMNAAAERLTGIKASEALGRAITEVITSTRLPVVLETGEAELNQQQLLGDITIVTNRVPVRDDQGHVIGAAAIFRDITEIKTLAEEITNLREMRALLQAIINSTQDAISVVDTEGHGLLINPAYTRLTGLTEQDVIGKPATVDIAEGESMHLQVLRTRKPVRAVPMKVGPKRREVLVNVAPMIVDDQLKGSVGVIHDVSEIMSLTEELEQFKRLVRRLEAKYTFDEIVAESLMMQGAVEQARRAAETPATVLLRGESGTGKELFAHAIHNASPRRGGQFIRVNCAALTDSLLESELFGYVEGAFTGAKKGGRRGLFEEATGGTIFLDEIGDVSLNLQAKLLRVLQEKEIIRVGDSKPLSVNVRIIAATNAHLEQAIARGTFREDLYYRLNVIPIFIPPLRHRREDIPRMAEFLVAKFNHEYGRNVERIAPEAMKRLIAYDWPGNVRELENIVGRAIINMPRHETEIRPEFLPLLGHLGSSSAGLEARSEKQRGKRGDSDPIRPLAEVLMEAEREIILQALRLAGGNKTEAARRLGIAARSLYYKLAKHKIG